MSHKSFINESKTVIAMGKSGALLPMRIGIFPICRDFSGLSDLHQMSHLVSTFQLPYARMKMSTQLQLRKCLNFYLFRVDAIVSVGWLDTEPAP